MDRKQIGAFAVHYGVTDALAPFPLHCLVNIRPATINYNIVFVNLHEALCHSFSIWCIPKEFSKYDSVARKTPDCISDYSDAVTHICDIQPFAK